MPVLVGASVALFGWAVLVEERRSTLVRAGAARPEPRPGAPEREPGPKLWIGQRLRAFTAGRRSRRKAVLGPQLADAVSAIASGSRAGLSLQQAVELAAGQVAAPLGPSLHEVADRAALGSPLDDALERWATAIPVPDVRLAAAVLRLHRRTGGALPPLLEGLARTLRERAAVAREVRSLTAQARLSGAIMGLLPIGFFAFLWLTSRRDVVAALHSSTGLTAIVVGLVMQTLAFVWIRHLLRVE
jgi:tight adherence protein B